ncbi:hypothetical protein HID58_039005 [Brassica napus]|uniref:Uncharacterized protein n=1 Tax=Brassica napus TaxID=3708 RepID=A0ABQ8BS13_BRANA|nr:hypothetical protein HID58_039005 [Brassica napus]
MGEDQRNHSDKGFFHHLAGYASGRYRPHGHHGYNNHGHHGYGVPYAYPAPPPPYGYPPVAYPPHGGYPPPGYPPPGYPPHGYPGHHHHGGIGGMIAGVAAAAVGSHHHGHYGHHHGHGYGYGYYKHETNCPSKLSSADSPRRGISQQRTLDRIAESRKRADNRKLSRFSPYDRGYDEPHNNKRHDHQPRERHNHSDPRDFQEISRENRREGNYHSRHYSSSGDREGNRSNRPASDRLPPVRENSYVSSRPQGMRTVNPASKGYWRPVSGDGVRGQSNSVQSQVSHTPSPRTQREPMILDRNPVASPYTPAASNNSGERRYALEHSGRLQEVNVQYLEDVLPYQTPPELMRPSSSKAAGGMRAQIELEGHSPIRTLNEDRAHVSLRLGPLPTDLSPLPSLVKAAPKAAGKKPTRAPSTRAAVLPKA